MKYVASVSFGKDSLAMLLMLLEEKAPLDEVVFYDTGMEFQAIYNTRDRVLGMLFERGITFSQIRPKYDFEWSMFDRPIKSRKTGEIYHGFSWCGGPCRWHTTEKTAGIRSHIRKNIGKDVVEYVGIAADEAHRVKEGKTYPLIKAGMTEADCLQYCYDRGFFWEEGPIRLYDILKRVSCWCCANKNLAELRAMYQHLPEYWKKLRAFQSRTSRPLKGEGKSVFDLKKRFQKELLVLGIGSTAGNACGRSN